MKRSPRQMLVIALSSVAYVFDELARIAAPPRPPVAFQNNEQIDETATFSEGVNYSGTRATFLP